MAIIAFANPKGGAGKTTSALILGTELAARTKVAVIDADPNHPITDWAALPGKPDNLTVLGDIGEHNIVETIDAAAETHAFVLVDLEGTASTVVAYAIGRADLVLIPLQAKQLDGKQAVRAIQLVKRQEKAFRRRIPHSVLLTRTSAAIRSRGLRAIVEDLEAAGVNILPVELIERGAFDAFLAYGGTLAELDRKEVSGVDKAIENARAYAAAVIQLLRENEAAEQSAAVAGGQGA
ncbi:MAG: ParA family protein [Tistrella sp.]|jgi:chromosome partitioning protein|uniref:Chromosome partitioning protein ParA n=1 Tax=Tistrella mobilis TaxID=171437 RepID=A0A162LGH4_9PROT|nr:MULTISPECIES: ParA family protein [Tistrella]KYO54870.1 chromosome partitioning protein ParA [Tistrella mobilis]MAD35961.1 ParA family protein [Tistrella sp.]MBA77695.1 ParA family protein [Tistrella sp.]HAE47170.1 ParA family protein [Tistrella mobilis]|tara:strand:- start:95 stop:802 length:708 start_codon:yes stop_codon:yes gene_type:complete